MGLVVSEEGKSALLIPWIEVPVGKQNPFLEPGFLDNLAVAVLALHKPVERFWGSFFGCLSHHSTLSSLVGNIRPVLGNLKSRDLTDRDIASHSMESKPAA